MVSVEREASVVDVFDVPALAFPVFATETRISDNSEATYIAMCALILHMDVIAHEWRAHMDEEEQQHRGAAEQRRLQ